LGTLFDDGRRMAAQTGGNDMPRAAAGGTGRGTRVRVTGTPWQGSLDALAADAKKFSDPVAMEAMQAASTAYILVETVANTLSTIGKTSVGVVWIDPRVSALMEGLGDFVRKAVKPTADAGGTITKAHDEKIRRIQENNPKERRWDIVAHDGRAGSGIRRQRRFGARTG
jgi:tetrahydromethanopterin S-methyltransferase subunit D